MKRITALIVLVCLILCAAVYWMFDRVSSEQHRQPPARLPSLQTTPNDKTGGGFPADDLPQSVDSKLEADAKMQLAIKEYQHDLETERQEVEILIDKYQAAALSEIPENFRLKMCPEDGETTGRFISYISDGIDKYLCDDYNGIHDYGEFRSVVSHDVRAGSFRQQVEFGKARGVYYGRGRVLDRTPLPTLSLTLDENGAIDYGFHPLSPPAPFFPDVACFANKQLRIGDTSKRIQKIGKEEVELTSTVLGYVEADNRKMVVFEESSSQVLPSGSRRQITCRMYYDIEKSIPVRVERRNATWFTEEYMKKRDTSKYPHSIPLSGQKHIIDLYQVP